MSYNANDESGDFFDDLRPNDGEKVIIKHMPSRSVVLGFCSHRLPTDRLPFQLPRDGSAAVPREQGHQADCADGLHGSGCV